MIYYERKRGEQHYKDQHQVVFFRQAKDLVQCRTLLAGVSRGYGVRIFIGCIFHIATSSARASPRTFSSLASSRANSPDICPSRITNIRSEIPNTSGK